MKKMAIYEPAMCCPTGLCGVGTDPELLRISTILNNMKKKGAVVERFNLNSAPGEFIKSEAVNAYINAKGTDGLPVVTVDGQIVIEGRYPTIEEFTSLLGLSGAEDEPEDGCGCGDGCGCEDEDCGCADDDCGCGDGGCC